MTDPATPKDGDFVAYLERLANRPPADTPAVVPRVELTAAEGEPQPAQANARQSIEDVLLEGEEPTQEFLDEFIELESAPPLSDEELERQALADPGTDGNPRTPE